MYDVIAARCASRPAQIVRDTHQPCNGIGSTHLQYLRAKKASSDCLRHMQDGALNLIGYGMNRLMFAPQRRMFRYGERALSKFQCVISRDTNAVQR